MRKITTILCFCLLLGCKSTGVGLPVDDMDIYYYKNLNNHKRVTPTDVLYIVDNKRSIPKANLFIGTIEITKTLIECEDEETCSPFTKSQYHSSEYLDYYAKKIGANYALMVEEDRIQTRHKERRYCAIENETCDPGNAVFETKEMCNRFSCKFVKVVTRQVACNERCREYDYEVVDGYVKVQRTIAELYRTKN